MGVIPMIAYGIINAVVLLLEVLWIVVGRPQIGKGQIPPGYLG